MKPGAHLLSACSLSAPREEFVHVLCALDKLNSWVRSDDSGAFGARRSVYFFKRHALIEAQARAEQGDFNLSHRPIRCDTTCRDCHGSGRYVTSYGVRRDSCRDCEGSGVVTLYFIETTMRWVCGPDEGLVSRKKLVWHSPEFSFPCRDWVDALREAPSWNDDPDGARAVWELERDWKPNTPGTSLPVEEAARYLNCVEMYYPQRPEPRYEYYGYGDSGTRHDFDYTLFLGTDSPGECALCGAVLEGEDFSHCYRVNRARIEWNAYACQGCRVLYSDKIFHSFPIPRTLISPSVRDWMRRHSAARPGTVHPAVLI